MNFFKNFIASFAVVASLLLISSCSKNSDPGSATVKFTTTTATYAEDKGAINIQATLSAAQSENVVITYDWASTDTTTYLGGDFNLLTPTSFIINKGETTGNLQIQIIDDTQIDPVDNLTFTLTGVSGGSVKLGTDTESKFTLTISNNDITQSGKLQTDLTWHLGSVNDKTNINNVNLDVYLQYNVSYTSNSITSAGDTQTSSMNTSGYETIFLNSTDTDQEYFIAVSYTSGSVSVPYQLTLNGFGYSNISGTGTLTSSESGYSIFWGPFNKSGSSFGRQQAPKLYVVDKKTSGFN